MSNPRAEPLPPTPIAPLPGLVINGKFLQASTSRSGVYRVARELLVALDRLLAENEALATALSLPAGMLAAGAVEIARAMMAT